MDPSCCQSTVWVVLCVEPARMTVVTSRHEEGGEELGDPRPLFTLVAYRDRQGHLPHLVATPCLDGTGREERAIKSVDHCSDGSSRPFAGFLSAYSSIPYRIISLLPYDLHEPSHRTPIPLTRPVLLRSFEVRIARAQPLWSDKGFIGTLSAATGCRIQDEAYQRPPSGLLTLDSQLYQRHCHSSIAAV